MPMTNQPIGSSRVIRLLAVARLARRAGGGRPGAAESAGGSASGWGGRSSDAAADVKSLHVQGNVWMLVGGGVERRRSDRRRRRTGRRHDDRAAGRQDARRDQTARGRQADSLRHQHARASGSHRRQREDRRGGTVDCGRQLRRPGRTGRRERRGGHRARERAQPHERAGRQPGAAAVQSVADRHVLRRRQGHLLQRRGRSSSCTCRPRTPTATSWCGSASPTWSSPATCSSRPRSR